MRQSELECEHETRATMELEVLQSQTLLGFGLLQERLSQHLAAGKWGFLPSHSFWPLCLLVAGLCCYCRKERTSSWLFSLGGCVWGGTGRGYSINQIGLGRFGLWN